MAASVLSRKLFNKIPHSQTLSQARQNSVRLYRRCVCPLTHAHLMNLSNHRRCLKEAPGIIRTYKLFYTVPEIRAKMKRAFLMNAHVSDPAIVDSLVLKGYNDLEECQENWQTRSHVVRWILSVPDEAQSKLIDLAKIQNPQERELMAKFFPNDVQAFDSFQKYS